MNNSQDEDGIGAREDFTYAMALFNEDFMPVCLSFIKSGRLVLTLGLKSRTDI